MDMVSMARDFAIAAHGGQMYGNYPYRHHLDAVAFICEDYGYIEKVVAYLHDVVEDTDVTLDEVASMFGKIVASYVEVLTDEPGITRKDRKAKTYAKMAAVEECLYLALIVKAADRIANMRASILDKNQKLIDMYKEEYSLFKASVYRPGICDELWEELEYLHSL